MPDSTPSMYNMARRACIRNIKSINDVGDVGYAVVRDILIKVETAEQLFEIETNSPQIIGEDEELWREFLRRDVPNYQIGFRPPKDPKDWYGIYKVLAKRAKNNIEKDAALLKRQMDGISWERQRHTSKIVSSAAVPKLPRLGAMRAVKEAPRGSGGSNSAILSFSSGSRTKMKTGRDVFNRAKREAMEQSLFHKSQLAVPTQFLKSKSSTVVKLAKTMIDDNKPDTFYQRTTISGRAKPPVTPIVNVSRQVPSSNNPPSQRPTSAASNRAAPASSTRTPPSQTPKPLPRFATPNSLPVGAFKPEVPRDEIPLRSLRRTISPESGTYTVPKLKPQPGAPTSHNPLGKRKPEVNIFMPPKRRRVV